MDKLLVNLDGASQGNPGESAIGVVMVDEDGNVVEEIGRYIGRATNNVAEYRALIDAAQAALEYMPQKSVFFTDSQLVANQINGIARVRQPHLDQLNREARSLLERLPQWQVRYVERTANWHAHRLAQQALLQREAEESSQSTTVDHIATVARRLDEVDQHKVLKYARRLLEGVEKTS